MELAAILKADLTKAVGAGAFGVADLDADSTVSAIGCIGRRDWDSDHFGIPMHDLQLHVEKILW